MNFFKLYIGDYQRDTGMLSLAEHGAYLLMLQHFYATEKPLPKGRELYRLLRCETKADRQAVDAVVSRFWKDTQEGLICTRAASELAKADHQRSVNREIGKRGGRPKRTEQVTESDIPKKTESVSEKNPNQTPDTRHQKKKEQKPKSTAAGAAEFFPEVPAEILRDFEAIRKAKKMPLTETAAVGIRREAERAGLPLADALRACCERGWAGFKADWLAREQASNVHPFPGQKRAGSQPEILPELTA